MGSQRSPSERASRFSRPRPDLLADLRQKIDVLEARPKALTSQGASLGEAEPVWRFGVREVDDRLPAQGLGGGLHDLVPAAYGDAPSVAAFVLALLSRRPVQAPVLWAQTRAAAQEFGRPYGPGLKAAGVSPPQMLTLTTRRDTDVLWALEEGLRARALSAVVGEVDDADFLASRRLALAAAATGTACFLIRTGRRGTASAGTSVWQIAPLTAPPDPWEPRAPGAMAWQAELRRARGGTPGRFYLAWSHLFHGDAHDETHRFRLVSPLADRADAAHRPAHRSTARSSAFG